MITWFRFELPWMWLCGIPLAAILLFTSWVQRRRGLSRARVAVLCMLRGLVFLLVLFLLARPFQVERRTVGARQRPVMVLLDRSESMSLRSGNSTRFRLAQEFFRQKLLPALKSSDLRVRGMVFDDHAEFVDRSEMESAKPLGKRTNLGGAIAQALNQTPQPLAIIALTDGIVNEESENSAAMSALLDGRIPFIGIGFGDDTAAQTLNLRRIEAPARVPSRTEFAIGAELELLNAEAPFALDLVLFRDAVVCQTKHVTASKGSRTWLENFHISEAVPGQHTYSVQLLPMNQPGLRSLNSQASTVVRIEDDAQLRVLYVQGALTWDYKFVRLALRDDPAVNLTGLSKTSEHSVFRQNVEAETELSRGFPTNLDDLAQFRVVVLADLTPKDLSSAQQELLRRFCGERGGGVLMIGGARTFDGSWQHSELEKILPVVFSPVSFRQKAESPFRIELTQEALNNPVFQLGGAKPTAQAWRQLPQLSHYARVDSAKLGAQVWMVHPTDFGPRGRSILMASQSFGAGLSAVLCLENFWKWRLAKDCPPEQFDRFWRQLFRWLGHAEREQVRIQFETGDLRPYSDIRAGLELQPAPLMSRLTNAQFHVEVLKSPNQIRRRETVELTASAPSWFTFQTSDAGTYSLEVRDSNNIKVASRSIEIRDLNLELAQTARRMESLRQWAFASEGLAFPAEECPKTSDLVAQIQRRVLRARQVENAYHILGLNGWVMTFILGLLCGEWSLRRSWSLV